MTSRVRTIDAAREISAHGVGVHLDETSISVARPSTWDEWHAEELAVWQTRFHGACELISAARNEGHALRLNRDRWRLASVFGWGFVVLLILARMQG